MSGDGLGFVSSGPMSRLVASLKVKRCFGDELRQWRRPSRASSATPHTRVTRDIACGGGGVGAPPLPSTAPPTSPISFGGGGGAGWPRLRSTLWGTLTLRWLGHWSGCGLLVSKLLMGWLCSWRTCGATPCRPNPRGPPGVLHWRYLYLSVRGLLCLLLIWMWRKLQRRWCDTRCDSDSTAVSSALSGSGESPASARNAPAAPAATTTSESASAEFTPGSQPPTGVGGKRARHARTIVQAPGTGTRYDSWSVPAKRLRIPNVSGRARAQGRGPVREVERSFGSSPPEGVIRGIPSSRDPMLRSARGLL